MKITSLVENTSNGSNLPVEHGLCLHIELDNGKKILFDMGQGNLFLQNAETLNINLEKVDVAVISHGHYDHGGGLSTFLKNNSKAPVFLHKKAFEKHYSLRDNGLTDIGLDDQLKNEKRLRFCEGTTFVDDQMVLVSDVNGCLYKPLGNRLLFGPQEGVNDDFCHEQSLLVKEGNNAVLLAGCAHTGIANILKKVVLETDTVPTHVFAGFHLVKSGLDEIAEFDFIRGLASELKNYSHTKFFTMHCTGVEQYNTLHKFMGEQINYFACGDSMVVE